MAHRRGRPVQGAELVESIGASGDARNRLKLIIQTLSGTITIAQACQKLGIGRSMFNKLRSDFLSRAAALLEPRTPGPKKPQPSAAELELQQLREENARLKLDIKTQQVRQEIALVMPRLIKPDKANPAEKKTPRR